MKGNTMTQPSRTDADDFLGGGGVPSASFDGAPPIAHVGVITEEPVRVQARDFTTQEPKFYEGSTDPVMQLKVIIQTDQRDPAIEDDDGRRALYLGGSRKPESRSKLAATIKAVKDAGAPGLRVGGRFGLRYVADGESKRPGKPPKMYEGFYQAPAPDADALFAPEAAQAPVTPPASTSAVQQPWPATPGGQTPTQPVVADPWSTPPAQVPGQATLPVSAPGESAARTTDEAMRLAGILKSQGVQNDVIQAAYPQLTPEQIASLPPF